MLMKIFSISFASALLIIGLVVACSQLSAGTKAVAAATTASSIQAHYAEIERVVAESGLAERRFQ